MVDPLRTGDDMVTGTTTGNVPTTIALRGWECPKCGRVHAPFVSTCPYCVGDNVWQPYSAPAPYYPSTRPTYAPYWGPFVWYSNCEPRTQ